MPRPAYDPVEVRLIAARVSIMRTNPPLAEVFCRYVFEEGFNVATLAGDSLPGKLKPRVVQRMGADHLGE